ncbi:putative secreted protein (Por secretion system target) [Nonlabens dokdonensis]|uniref:P/Homo B domain-containing protein n=2 Tax=Nonlabens dokdonensis TaxID=328515 RepID=L7W685_NONDD|nr:zinc-dependent metalloprotease family protein [Nonlabens dokdonensis]AGC75639.1 hypothetical protein DDD_0512 [Nonlabens dokdonensis DSW-6]PZX43329.1 putative secreted protein (Por secretion system target) [Nonlabens dokdonensis]
MKKLLLVTFWVLLPFFTFAQSIWQPANTHQLDKIADHLKPIQPNTYDLFEVNVDALSDRLDNAVDRFSGGAAIDVDFPVENNQFETFSVYSSGTVSPELQIQYPEITSFVGQSQQNPLNKIYFTITSKGFHGLITGEKILYMDPYSKVSPESIMIYNRKNLNRPSDDNFECHTQDEVDSLVIEELEANLTTKAFRDRVFRTYDIAIAATAEYTAYHDDGNASNGNAISDALAAIVVTLTRVNSVYELEMSMRFSLIGNNSSIIYTNSQTDPYSNYSGSAMLSENRNNLNAVIGSGNFDIGHVFSTGGGGIAGTSPCGSGKAEGVTGIVTPEFDPFDIDYVCHEIGHQYGASHTFYNGCFGGFPSSQPFETGSASTIMGYAGICAPNVQDNSDAYFHAVSIQQMHNSIDIDVCDDELNLNSSNPTAPISNNLATKFLPISTPFKLTANSGQAPDGGEVYTYNWEQWDTGSDANTGAPQPPLSTNTIGPMFRSKFASTDPTRYFPNLEEVLNGSDDIWETLNSVSRDMRFVCTIRDNNPNGGQTDRGEVIVMPRSVVGPFVVNTPLSTEIWHEGETKSVTWDVAGTNRVELATEVNILLSLDGGYTYPVTLASGVSNTGSRNVTIPTGTKTNNARIMVEAVGNYFFNVNNGNFKIKESTFELTTATNDFSTCKPSNGSFSFTYNAAPDFNETVTFSAIGLPAGLTANFSPSTTSSDSNVDVIILGTSSVDAGEYDFSVQAQSTSATISEDFSFKVFENSVGDVVQTSPMNGAGNQVANPLLEWIDLESASSYLVEISENSNFSSIVESDTVSFQNNYQPSSLVHSTIYYWRVTPSNDCSTGQNASISSFQTAQDVCRVYDNETYINTAQPTNRQNEWSATNVNAVSAIIDVPDDIQITNLSFYMNATHSDTGDIKMQLSAPSGRFSEVYNRDCADGANFNLTVSDQGTQSFGCASSYRGALTGNQRPGQAFSRFNGLNAQGEWVLLATDRVGGNRDRNGNIIPADGGTFNEFSVTVCGRLQYVNDIDNNRNLGLITNYNATNTIDQTLLRSAQAGFTNSNLTYVVTNDTDYGQIQLNGVNLNVGDTFTQGDLNNGLIQYVHDSTELVNADSFDYTVLGGSNTLLEGQTFSIAINDPVLTYNGASWEPFAPNADTGSLTAEVLSGVAPISLDSQINNLTVFGGVLDIATDISFTVNGTLTVDGILDGRDGSLIINNSTAQTISGSGTLELGVVEVNNSAGLTFNTATNIYDVLKPQSSTLFLNDNVTFKSNATSTGQLDNSQNATINGNAKVEQFIPAKRAYRFLASSVNSTSSIRANWQEGGSNAPNFGTHITGGGAINGFDVNSSGANSLFTFDNNNLAWTAFTNTNMETLQVGVPLRMFVRGDRTVDLTDNNTTPTNTTLRSSGTIYQGDFTQSFTTANGEFAMIANPYQAIVNFEEVLSDASTSGLNPTFMYVWDPNINTRGAYVTVDVTVGDGMALPASSTANKFLQPGQSVFVPTTGPSSIQFRESDKAVNQTLTQVFSSFNQNSFLSITLKDAASMNLLDQTIFQFDPTFDNAVTTQDAFKFTNIDESLASMVNGDLLSINRKQLPIASERTNLHLRNYRSSTYVFEIEVALGAGLNATLVDQESGQRTPLQDGMNSISFNVNASGSDVDRFYIEYSNVTLNLNEISLSNSLSIYPNPVTENTFVLSSDYLNGKEVTMILFNTLGQRVYDVTTEFNNNFTIKPSLKLSSGMYILKVQTAEESGTVKVIVR